MSVEWKFSLTDHACRQCLGRVLERNGVFMCAVCESTAIGDVTAICGCGMKSESGRDMPKGLRLAYACSINQDRTVVNPSRIVIVYGGKLAQPLGIQ